MAKKKEQTDGGAAALSKHYKAENVEIRRSDIHFADYNPRTISKENLQTLRKGIKKFGLVGGIVVNRQTGNTLVQGHQRLTVMDELQKYNPDTHENDYLIRADIIDIDPKSEKELVILLNNPNAQGEWDYTLLKDLVPTIDYVAAGLTDQDLAMIGVGIEESVAAVSQSVAQDFAQAFNPSPQMPPSTTPPAPMTQEERVQHMKEVKQTVSQQASEKAEQADAYLMLSFDNMDNLQAFLSMFDLPEHTQIVKGEDFMSMLEEGGE